jgi:HlyD family secretion protein
MDVPRKNASRNRAVKRGAIGIVLLGAVAGLSVFTSRLKPAAPQVDGSTVWRDAVKRGEMLRQVRGLGSLVPEEILHVPAPFAGRVERVAMLAGTTVNADTVLVELKNPDMEQQVRDATWALQTAESDLTNQKAQFHSQRLNQKSDLTTLQAQYRDSKARNDRDEVLYKQGLMLELDYRLSKTNVEDLLARIEVEKERGVALAESLDAQLASKQTQITQLQAMLQVRRDQVAALIVRAGVAGVLQQIVVQQGQQISPGADLAIVVQPRKLKAALAITETQAKDVLLNQKAEIDTHNGIIPGRVIRIDPSVVNGTRTVDVRLEGALPAGAVPDLSVDGTIEIERLADIVYMGRPVGAEAGGSISIFRINPDGKEANKVKVKLGRTSVSTVEIVDGLRVGDKVILSDMSTWDSYDRIRLN